MFSLSLAQLRTQAHRLIATALAIIIAVGFVVATLTLNETSKKTVYGALSSQYLTTDAVATYDWEQTDSESPTPQQWTQIGEKLRALPGVAAVALDQYSYSRVQIEGVPGATYGQVQTLADSDLRWQKLTSGTWPEGDGQVVAAADGSAKVGDRITLTLSAVWDAESGKETEPERDVQATVVGLTDRSSSIIMEGDQYWTTPAQNQAWNAQDVESIRIAATPGTTPADLTTEVASAVQAMPGGESLTVRTGEGQAEAVARSVSGNNAELVTVLLVFAAISVFVCTLVIANTFTVLLAQRVRELALLRAIGAAGGQLRRGVLLESFVIGLTASALGVATGIALAAGVSAIASQFESVVPLNGVAVTAQPVLIGLALGTVVTMVAAFNPARKATKVAPLAAMRPMDEEPINTGRGLVRRALGLLLGLPGIGIAYYGGTSGDLMLGAVGGMLFFLGALLLCRWLVPIAVAGVGRVLGPLGQVPGKLAALNSTRNPQRTAATATALIVGVTLCTTMVVGAATTRASATALIDDSYPTDVAYYVGDEDAPATLAGTISGVKNVSAAIPVEAATVDIGSLPEYSVQSIDTTKSASVVRSDKAGLIPEPGTIVLAEYLAPELGIKEGDPVKITKDGRSIELKAHLVFSSNVNSPRVTSTDLAQLTDQTQMSEIWAQLADDMDDGQLAETLRAIATAAADVDPNGTLAGSAEERASFNQLLDILLLIVLGLLAVAVVIAIIGVGNTMALSVLERRKESGVLRALGLTRGQLRWMLLWEAMLIAGVAAAIGVVLGSVFGVLGVKAALQSSGAVAISIPLAQVLLILVVATIAGALASVLPSRRAAKISPVAAIASA
ncbi:ABC transporter permease [Kineosporia babensis]|uniref:ABC transporter permease n=1 Tax=Kineosporia babensis TaxID=499548 RepID=A0A9X1N954_9ACTN|nr:FtsX family ABC transporter permease [Kineosporia babensis]MCD5309465.1 ABC transporter permease [Kineosporia babensis]